MGFVGNLVLFPATKNIFENWLRFQEVITRIARFAFRNTVYVMCQQYGSILLYFQRLLFAFAHFSYSRNSDETIQVTGNGDSAGVDTKFRSICQEVFRCPDAVFKGGWKHSLGRKPITKNMHIDSSYRRSYTGRHNNRATLFLTTTLAFLERLLCFL